jgi:exopolysaccharide production protein ExoY
MVILIVTIALTSPGPAIFAHERIGRHGQLYRCLKFRSMFVDAGERLSEVLANDAIAAAQWRETQKIKADPRVTSLGKFLRQNNLDELPQLVNVLRGHMSIVGPRPVVVDEAPRFGTQLPIVLSVKPGLTGLWQISGRNDTSYAERVRLDVTYVETRSLFRDILICLKTAILTVRSKTNGAY